MTQESRNPMIGAAWMGVTGLCFVAFTVLVKMLGTRLPAPEAAFIRYVLGLVFLLPLLGTLKRLRLDRGTLVLFSLRGVAHGIGVILWFYAIGRIPVAEVTSINYIAPICVTLLGAIFLNEPIAMRRLLATAFAFAGALVILRPGFRELDPGHIAMLGTASAFAVSYTLTKLLSRTVSPAVIVAMLSITVTVVLAPFALANWVTPSLGDLVLLFGTACLATAGHYTMTRAFAAAPLAVTQPVTFLQLVWSILAGMVFFGEPFDIFVIIGGTIIIGSLTFMAWREMVLNRRSTPQATEPKV